MRLTAAQYSRGLVSWTPIAGVEIQVGTAPDALAPKQWTENLADPAGSLLLIDLQPVFTFRVWLHGQAVVNIPDFWIRLERLNQGVVITRFIHGAGNPPVMLRHLPDYGTYHRLVVDRGSFSWDEDVVFRELGIMVRFVTGEIEIERVTNLHAAITDDGQLALDSEQSTAKVNGRFLEVLTPGKTAQQAEQHAYATLGLLAVALGPNLLGAVVSSEPWEANPLEQLGTAVATGAAFARAAAAPEFDVVGPLLVRMTVDEPMARARVISLRWYERGRRASAPLDKLLSFFIGVETLVTAFAKIHAPLPIEQERGKEDDAILALLKKLGKKIVGRVAQRIRGASLREQFAFYSEKHGLGAAGTGRFDKSKKVRDAAVHGDEVDVTFDVASDAEQLLRVMLKSDFEVGQELAWEAVPVVHEIRAHFALVAANVAPAP